MRHEPRAAALGLILSAIVAMPAFAHAHLAASIPAADAAVAVAPVALVLHFTEEVEVGFTGVTLKDAGGHLVPTGATMRDTTDSTAITVPVQAPLVAGRYVVAWHALAVDGHKTTGSYSFVVAPKAATP